jgi:TPR repeat protein
MRETEKQVDLDERSEADIEELKERCRKALELTPDDAELLTELAVLELHDLQVPHGEGVELLQRAFDLDRSDTISFSNYLGVLAEVADEEEIDEVCLQAIEAGNVTAMFELGVRLDERDEPREAIPHLRRAAANGHAEASSYLAALLREVGDQVGDQRP